jgi:hypothetical protein
MHRYTQWYNVRRRLWSETAKAHKSDGCGFPQPCEMRTTTALVKSGRIENLIQKVTEFCLASDPLDMPRYAALPYNPTPISPVFMGGYSQE